MTAPRRSPLVEIDRHLRDAGGDQGGQVERLVPARLGVADAHLDRAEGVVGPHAPPELRGLDDRVGLLQQAHEVRVRLPVAERLVDPAAREGAGEDLGAHRVQPGVAVVEKGGVGGKRKERRQQLAHPVRDRDGAIGAVDPDVNVQAPGVVPLGDPAQVLLEPAVVLGVDDVLVEVVRPGVGAHRRQRQAHLVGDGEQPRSPGPLPLGRVREGLAAARPDLDLGVDQLALDRRARARGRAGRRPASPRSGARGRGSPDRGSRTPPRSRP